MKLTIPEVELPNAELLGKRRLEKFAAKAVSYTHLVKLKILVWA